MSLGAVQFPHLGDSAWILHIIILWNKLERRIGVDIERVVDGIGIEDASVLQGSFDVIAHVVGGATPDGMRGHVVCVDGAILAEDDPFKPSIVEEWIICFPGHSVVEIQAIQLEGGDAVFVGSVMCNGSCH